MRIKLTSIIFILAILGFFTYNFFLSSFKELEKEQNRKNLNSLVLSIDKKIKHLKSIAKDYAVWDSTFDFIDTKDKEYIEENFSEGSSTLEDLKIDFMLFTTLKNERIYSKYVENEYNNKNIFEIQLFDSLKNFNNIETIYQDRNNLIKDNSTYLYIIKKTISNTNNTAKTNGFLYIGKVISNESLKNDTNIFENIYLDKKTFKKNDQLLDSSTLKKIEVKTDFDKDCNCLINTLQLYNHNNEHTFSIITKSKRELIEKGKRIIYIYSFINFIFLFFIFLLIFKNQNILKNYNDKLENEVEEKTKKIQESNKKLKILSEEDGLTKIKNRRYFFELGNKIIKNSFKNNSKVSVVMIDLDNFKKINDKYGHSAGDEVLIDFVNIVNKTLNNKHLFARLGGEEFSIIFIDIEYNEANEIVEKIRKNIEDSIVIYDDIEIKYTISVGITNNEKSNNLDDMLKNADKLLYIAKNRGKNCIIRQRESD